MMSSLFEIYDPYSFVFRLNLGWLGTFFVFFGVFLKFWVRSGSLFLLVRSVLLLLSFEFGSLYVNLKIKKTSVMVFIMFFFYVLLVNLIGLVPYTFSSSSHFLFSLGVGFPFWCSFMLLGWWESADVMFAHLIPLGTPLVLIPLMVMIETASNLIRPWSLSIRLMANMISGHLLMSLLGGCGSAFLVAQAGLFLFEFFVCFIQAYVFSVLLALYASEI